MPLLKDRRRQTSTRGPREEPIACSLCVMSKCAKGARSLCKETSDYPRHVDEERRMRCTCSTSEPRKPRQLRSCIPKISAASVLHIVDSQFLMPLTALMMQFVSPTRGCWEESIRVIMICSSHASMPQGHVTWPAGYKGAGFAPAIAAAAGSHVPSSPKMIHPALILMDWHLGMLKGYHALPTT